MAVLININITLGSGIFINTFILSKLAGALSGVTYALVGLLLFPLILTFSHLLRLFPAGGFYVYGKQGISTFVGFLSTWIYFVGKLASATMAIHAAMCLLQKIFPPLATIPALALDTTVITIYTLLNMLNVQQGSKIQMGFIAVKIVPILFIILSGFFILQPINFSQPNIIWEGFLSTIPLSLFTFYGFEAACNISMLIENSQRNAWKVLLISHLVATSIIILFQTLLYGSIGPQLRLEGTSFLDTFQIFIQTCCTWIGQETTARLTALMYVAIASSALGAAYGMIYSNSWNLHLLAKHEHTFFSSVFKKLNKNLVPYWCIITEACICLGYLLLTQGNQLYLQQTGVFSLTITYFLSVFSFLAIARRRKSSLILPLTALTVCCFLVFMCIRNFIIFGMFPLVSILTIALTGTAMFARTPGKSSQPTSSVV